MNAKAFRTAMKEMAEAGLALARERGGETLYSICFLFGEWAGESEREIIEDVTGISYDDFNEEQIDALCDAFLEGDAGTRDYMPKESCAGKHTGASKTVKTRAQAGQV